MQRQMLFTFLVIMMVMLVGCSKAPEIEMQTSQTSLNTARSAEAEQYAPDTYRMAADTLNAALAAKEEQDSKFALLRSYGKSKEMFERAKVLADQAAAEAAAEKERIKQETMTLMTDAQAALDEATAALASAPVGKGNKAEIELIKADLAGAVKAFEEARSDFDAGMYKVAQAKTEAVIQKAKSLSDEIATAAARKAGK